MLNYYSVKGRVAAIIRSMRNGKQIFLYYSTGLTDEGWQPDKQRFSDNYKDRIRYLKKIDTAIRDVISDHPIHSLSSKSFRLLVDNKLNKGSNSFFSFAESWFQEQKELRGLDKAKQIQFAINLVREFDSKTTFEKIGKDYYSRFLRFLEKKGYTLNTTGAIIKNFKLVLKAAHENGINTNDSYRDFKKPIEDVVSVYLSEVEIETIHTLRITHENVSETLKVKDVAKSIRALEKARKHFLIGCCTGLRVGNYSKIDPATQIIGDFLYVVANKNGEKLKIPLHRIVREILASGWPGPMFEQKINKQIKDLCKLAGINEKVITYRTVGGKRQETVSFKYELITTHTARRSFASNLLLRGVPKQYIMAITGHKTERDFNRYTASVAKDMLSDKISEYPVWG